MKRIEINLFDGQLISVFIFRIARDMRRIQLVREPIE